MAARGTANLRAVKDGAAAKRSTRSTKPKDVSAAAASGDHRALLVAMRERIAFTVSDPGCPPRDLAALTRRLQEIAKEIEAIDLREREEAKESEATADEEWDEEAL